jgi:hypothetical protein
MPFQLQRGVAADARTTPHGSNPLVVPAVGALVLVTSLLNFLHHNHYPVLAPEVAIIVAVLIGAAAVFGLLHWLAVRFGRPVLDVLLVYAALDLCFDGVGVAIAAVAAAVLLRRLLIPLLGIIFAVAFATEIIALGFGGGAAGLLCGQWVPPLRRRL